MENDTKKAQLVIIGAGPGGYAAAFYAADMGLDVTLIDKRKTPGGVCLYEGCIPSKAYLHAAAVLNEAEHSGAMGIEFEKPKVDITKLRLWKDSIVDKLTNGLQGLSKKRGINYIQATVEFKTSSVLKIHTSTTSYDLEFENVLIATGSKPVEIPSWPASDRIMNSTGALDLNDIPETMLVVGGGYIGLEMCQFYLALGCKITIVEMENRLLPGIDPDLVNPLAKKLKGLTQDLLLNTKVLSMKEIDSAIEVEFQNLSSAKTIKKSFSKILVAIGRNVDLKELKIENTSIKITDRGFIQINPGCQTSEKNVYAIGDVTGGVMLAHKASAEGKVAIDAILGKKAVFEPRAIPAVVFTNPEIATCGLTENEAKENGIEIKVVKFPFSASGRALTLIDTEGFVKLIVTAQTGVVLGGGIVGPSAGELIAEITLAIEMGAIAQDIALTIHSHPTLSESIMEAAENFLGHSTHMYSGRKQAK